MIDHQDLGNKKHQTQGLNCAAWTSTMKRKIFFASNQGGCHQKSGISLWTFWTIRDETGCFLRMERDFSGPMAKSSNMAGIRNSLISTGSKMAGSTRCFARVFDYHQFSRPDHFVDRRHFFGWSMLDFVGYRYLSMLDVMVARDWQQAVTTAL